MRALITTCERYFTRPLCEEFLFGGHVHTQDCWHEELQDARSDLRAALTRAKNLHDELEELRAKHQSRTGGITGFKGTDPSWVWIDETNAYSVDGSKLARAERQLNELIGARTPVFEEQSAYWGAIRNVLMPDGTSVHQTPDGKKFTSESDAKKHMARLRRK